MKFVHQDDAHRKHPVQHTIGDIVVTAVGTSNDNGVVESLQAKVLTLTDICARLAACLPRKAQKTLAEHYGYIESKE